MERTMIYQVEVDDQNQGTRVDLVLSMSHPELSRNFIQKLIDLGNMTIDTRTCRDKKYKVKAGENVTLSVPEPEELKVYPEDIPLNIVYEDEDLLVVNKEKGMVVHPGVGNYTGTLVNALLHHCGDTLSSINGVIRPGIVHRIDKDTSGLLMIAKNDISHRSLTSQLSAHTITRAYLAVVYHNFLEDEGTINTPIGRDPSGRLRQAVNHQNGKSAITHFKVLERFGLFTLIEARLETGRTHQIRVHMSDINHPLLGDPLYGPKKKVFGAESQMLHARLLGFVHPRTGDYMEFESTPPEEFLTVLEKLRKGR